MKEEVAKKEKSSGQEDKEKFLESKSYDPRLTALRTDLQKTKGVDKVTLPLVNKKGHAAVYTVTATTAPSSCATEDLVNSLRNDVIPKATNGKQMSADLGGMTASYIELASEITNKLPLVIRNRTRAFFILPPARLPLTVGPAQGGGDERVLHPRRLRRRYLRLQP